MGPKKIGTVRLSYKVKLAWRELACCMQVLHEFLASHLKTGLATRVARPSCAGTYTASDNALSEKLVWLATHGQLLSMFAYINYSTPKFFVFLILFDKFASI